MKEKDPSVATLQRLQPDVPLSYDVLLHDRALLELTGNIDNLSAIVYKLVAQGFAKIETVYSENGEENITVILTNLGQAFLVFKATAGDVLE